MKIFEGKKNLFKTVKTAESFAERFTGLLGRKSIPESYVMFFPDCNSIHTYFMKNPIDVIMTDAQGRVVLVREALKPWRLAGCLRAENTMEMRAGTIRTLKLKLNDKLTIKHGS